MTATLRVPFDIGPTGRIGRADSPYDAANQYLKVLLLTRISERVMRPGYGTEVRDGLFDVVDEVTIASMESEIRDAVREWEPAVSIEAIEIDAVGSMVRIDILYRLVSTLGGAPVRFSVEIEVGGAVEETPL